MSIFISFGFQEDAIYSYISNINGPDNENSVVRTFDNKVRLYYYVIIIIIIKYYRFYVVWSVHVLT